MSMWAALTVIDSIFQISQCPEKFSIEKFVERKEASKQKFDSSKTIGNNQKIVK